MTATSMPKPDSALHDRVARLRELLRNAKDLAEIADYFEAGFCVDSAFMDASKPAKRIQLVQVLAAVLRQIAPQGRVGAPLVLRLEEHLMCHGFTFWGDGVALFFYFEDVDVGFCVWSSEKQDCPTSFARFSVHQGAGWLSSIKGGGSA
ncbi:MAG: hypothetical protein ACOY0T_30820 [Myxococcota bacterium]